ncbi:hypothetical protein GQ600_9694 [Phytophthora cactorum]|nr:hypothetical protein GQ600_9694 [Phytophthora cactorum]
MSGFRHRWAELKKEAWDSKPPTGLSNDDTHLKPGMTKKDVRGVTVWVKRKWLHVATWLHGGFSNVGVRHTNGFTLQTTGLRRFVRRAAAQSAGGIAGIAGGRISADILKDVAGNGWTKPVLYRPYPYLDQPYEPRNSDAISEDFPRLYGGDYGPTTRALETALR